MFYAHMMIMLKNYFKKKLNLTKKKLLKANQPELDEAFVLLRDQVVESATVSTIFYCCLNFLLAVWINYLTHHFNMQKKCIFID